MHVKIVDNKLIFKYNIIKVGGANMLKYIKDRLGDYNANSFIMDMATASKNLGMLEAKINSYKFNSILVPMLQRKEAISSMYIEGTQTTISDVFESEMTSKCDDDKVMIEFRNHTKALIYGSEYLQVENFTHSFIQKIHALMMDKILSPENEKDRGKYKSSDNRIVNSVGTVIYTPPTHSETKKYMDELISYMNNTIDDIHPLIKAAIIHSQFESIHPFSDGNGRVGRVLVSLYLFKAKVINFPFFYMSEAISADKSVYYNMLTDTRKNNYNEWIKYFLKKITVQTTKLIGYIDSLNDLYRKTKSLVQKSINSPKFDAIIECLFTHPVLNADYLADKLSVSHGQAIRYLNILERERILQGNDRKRGRLFFFGELMDLARGI